jgi:hypothetical protein
VSETTITRRYCRICSVEIFRKGPTGRPPSRCSECIAEFKRQNARHYDQRVKEGYERPTHFQCIGCKGIFPRLHTEGQVPLRCDTCWAGNEFKRGSRRVAEAMAELRRIFETEGRWTSCEICDADIRCRAQKGAAPRWCDPCRNERRRESDRASRPWDRRGVCPQCGGPEGRLGRDGRRLICWPCLNGRRNGDTGRWLPRIAPERRADAEKYGESAVRLRGPWDRQYTNIEIFRRDGWKCQICLKRVDETLRSPHPKSASADHIIPRSQGGLDLRENVRLACRACNSSRCNRGGGEQLMLLN